MYNPARFQSTDLEQAIQLIYENPFATLVSIVDGEPMISQIPLTIVKPTKLEDREILIVGHFARANPHSKIIHNSKCTAVFQGPHTYITPMWYAENDVPTWNYSTVHVKAETKIFESYDETLECLKALRDQAEKLWPSGWEFFVPEDLQGAQLTKSIVAFQLKVLDVQFKQKLSQNRSKEDKNGILNGLKSRSDDGSRGVLTAMEKLYL